MRFRRWLEALTCGIVLAALGCQKTVAAGPLMQPAARESGTPVVVIEPEVLHTGVKRFGINLSGQSFYDSGQMLRNLTFRNPGFEGETWQSILHCKSVSANTCTDENQYAVWPAGFLDGGQFSVISGARAGTGGKIIGMQAATADHGVTVTLELQGKLTAGDFLLVRVLKPGNAQAGWWSDLKGGARLGTETADLSPHTPGRQALRVEAAGPGQSATVSSFFDSFEGRSFVQMRGRYTLRFRAKVLNGPGHTELQVQRLDTVHGRHSFFQQQIPLTATWTDYSFSFTGAEDGTAVGTVGLSFEVNGATVLLDDVSLTADAAATNPTAFRNEVVDALRQLHPGVLRYMDNGTDFGSSLENMLAVPFARQRSGSSEQETMQEDIPIGLHEFLVLCAAVGAEPWYSMPAGTSQEEAAELSEYLGGDDRTPFGARRTALGQKAPWTSVFPVIHLELGNEQWNARSFAGSAMNDPKAFGRRSAEIFRAVRSSSGYRASSFDLILGSWATVPWWSSNELMASDAHDSIALAPYLFNELNDASSKEAVFGPMFAEPELVDSRPNGYMAQQLATARAAGRRTSLAVYEVNLGTMSGSVPQAALNAAVPSMGAGLAVADHMLLMLREQGVTTQCLFALPEYVNEFRASSGAKEKMPLWGAVVDMGGATNGRRPQFLALQMINAALLPNMLRTEVHGTPQLWDQPESSNGKIGGKGLHLLQSFAFSEGDRRSLILLNLSRDRSLPVQLAGSEAPAGAVTRSVLTATEITANNEGSQQVRIQSLPTADVRRGLLLPPFSLTTLTWNKAPLQGSLR